MRSRRKVEDQPQSPPEIPDDHIEDATSFLENTRVLLKHAKAHVEDDSDLGGIVLKLENGLRDLSRLLGADWLDVEAIKIHLRQLQEILTSEVRLDLEELLGLSTSPSTLQ